MKRRQNLINFTKQTNINKPLLIFGFISVFLSGMGLSILNPIMPFLVTPYVHNQNEQALIVTLLTSVYALCIFFAAPILGALSDRYGRRPILLICILGSAIGYLVFGLASSILLLFVGRIIDGLTGGNISTLYAYFSDIIPPEKRTKYFGLVGAITGIGIILGPTIGGVLARINYSAPLYFAAIITLFNFIYGILYMKES
ncbi:MAG: MFS transporter, partial [Sarcina sp.]